MRQVSWLLLFFLFGLTSLASALDEINFSFTKPTGTPYLVGAPEMNVDAEEFTTLIIKIKSDKSATARLFWASSLDQQMNEPKSLWFFLNKSDDAKEYVFNVKSQNPNWIGFIPQILIFPDGGASGVEVESAKAVPGNLFTNIRSGWREFWGPKGRLVIGSTINTMGSVQLFGRPIFVYLYWLFGIIVVLFSALEIYFWSTRKKKKNSFNLTYNKIARFTFWTVIAFWLCLELSSLFNNWLQFKDDSRFIGKTPTEKLIMVNQGDFYQFIQFCERELPLNANFETQSPIIYANIKANYYLYPRKFKKDGEYLLLYDAIPDNQLIGKYFIWKKFRDRALILKRK